MRHDEGRLTHPSLAASMFERRVLFLSGGLDEPRAADLTMALMALDADGDDPVALHIDSLGGPLDAALSVIDTIELLRAPVHARASGRVEGSAIGVLAVCDRRRAFPNAQFRLCAPDDRFAGAASDAEQWIRRHRDRLDRFVARLSRATGQPVARLHRDIERGLFLEPNEALHYGLIDEVLGRPDADVVPLTGRVDPRRPRPPSA